MPPRAAASTGEGSGRRRQMRPGRASRWWRRRGARPCLVVGGDAVGIRVRVHGGVRVKWVVGGRRGLLSEAFVEDERCGSPPHLSFLFWLIWVINQNKSRERGRGISKGARLWTYKINLSLKIFVSYHINLNLVFNFYPSILVRDQIMNSIIFYYR